MKIWRMQVVVKVTDVKIDDEMKVVVKMTGASWIQKLSSSQSWNFWRAVWIF